MTKTVMPTEISAGPKGDGTSPLPQRTAMSLRDAGRLSFGRIADAWAQEMAGRPDAMTRDEILSRLVQVFWRGDFETLGDAGASSALTISWRDRRPSDARDGFVTWDTPSPVRFFRNKEGEAIGAEWASPELDDKGQSKPLTAVPREHVATRDMIYVLLCGVQSMGLASYDDLAGRPISIYSDEARSNILELLTVSKADFRDWIGKAGHKAPRFWFDATDVAARRPPASASDEPVARRKGGRKPGPYRQRMWRILDQARQHRPDYLDQPFSKIEEDLRHAFKRDYPDGSCRLPERSALQDALKAYKRERGL
jgi:hypothetical protein